MRGRQHLELRIQSIESIERSLDDNAGLIELGEAEGDAAVVQGS